MQDYRRLKVWQEAHSLVLEIYKSTRYFPTEERYGLTSQLRRSSSSVPTNIVEGAIRQSDADFRRFLYIAAGSANEVDYLLLLCGDLGLLSDKTALALRDRAQHVRRMLVSLIERLVS